MRRTFTTMILAVAALAASLDMVAHAQVNTTYRDPLIYGATSTAPLQAAPQGQPPPVGDGFSPPPVNPGMANLGLPTLIPTVPMNPANDIENPSVRINWDPTNRSAPGEAGPGTWAPPPPSTPGDDPGIIHAPLDFGPPPAQVVNINPGGGIPGSAGDQRWGGQQSHDFGPYRHRGTRKYDFGDELSGQSSYDGGQHARSGATDTQDLYGNRYPLRPTKQAM